MLNRSKVIFVLLVISACDDELHLQPFTSDGCSLFPDRSAISQQDWCVCCFEHDLAYWQGGTFEQRVEADQKLKKCVFQKTGNELLASAMYEGVRYGGSPYFYNWYRWGYGWPYQRKYRALTSYELRQVQDLKDQYFKESSKPVCFVE